MIDTPWAPSAKPRLNWFERLVVSATVVGAINAGVAAVSGVEIPREIGSASLCGTSPMSAEEATALGCPQPFGTAFEAAVEIGVKGRVVWVIAIGAIELGSVYSILGMRRRELESAPMELQGVEA